MLRVGCVGLGGLGPELQRRALQTATNLHFVVDIKLANLVGAVSWVVTPSSVASAVSCVVTPCICGLS